MAIQNGTSSADYKVPDGKLLRVAVTVADGRIVALHINGDYFMHPESAVEDIEAHLTGMPVEADALKASLDAYIKENDIEIIGADAASVVHAILLATE